MTNTPPVGSPSSVPPVDEEITPAFHVHRRSNSAELIIASDFLASTGRTVGGFGDLVPRLRTDHAVWETAPPAAEPADGVRADHYLDRWLEDVRASGHTVPVVFGFCVGSVFAAALAEQIATWQERAPRLILFDPERPHPALLHRHFEDALQIIAKALTDEEMKSARRAGEAATAASSGLVELAIRLSDTLIDFGDPALRKAGLNEKRRSELLDTFSSFLSYLAASAEIDPGQSWREATAISSATPRNGLNVLPPEQRSGTVGREIRFDLQHPDLLRSSEVAQAVHELLG